MHLNNMRTPPNAVGGRFGALLGVTADGKRFDVDMTP